MPIKLRAFGAALGLAAMLGGCAGPAADELDGDRQIARAVLDLLATDGKPVCVERLTYGDPLQVYRSARRGELQHYYRLGWGKPAPLRPPEMPTQEELFDAVAENRSAGLPDAPRQANDLPRELRTAIDGQAYALSPAAIPTRAVVLQERWLPDRVHARWWPGRNTALGCRANYVLSSIKRTDRIAFMAVRVDHWATLYALVRIRGSWTMVGQWSSWMY